MDKYVETNMSFWKRLKFLFTNLLPEHLCPIIEIEKKVIQKKIVKVPIKEIIQVPVREKETIIEKHIISNGDTGVKKEIVIEKCEDDKIPFFELADDKNVKSNL